jgi:hypothetical protein
VSRQTSQQQPLEEVPLAVHHVPRVPSAHKTASRERHHHLGRRQPLHPQLHMPLGKKKWEKGEGIKMPEITLCFK